MVPTIENELIAQAKAGNTEAFESLAVQYMPMLFAYSRAICGDFHAAHDVVQQSFLIAYRKLNHFFVEADFGTWLRAIARREALEVRRKLGKAPSLTLDAVERSYQDPSPEAVSQERKALATCLKSLGGSMGKIVQAHYYEGVKLGSLSESLGMTLAAVKQLLYRARIALKGCVRKRLGMEGAP